VLGGFSEALSKEVWPLGIKVTCVEPGGFRTDWAGSSMSFAPDVEGYESTVDGVKGFLTSGSFVPVGDPDKAAKVMIELVSHPEPPLHLVLGSEAIGILERADAVQEKQNSRNGSQSAFRRIMMILKISLKRMLRKPTLK
jgi:NAD(P)-dependent dehydrogenase (short-subunit alcohol dehydrogenase family)